MLLIAGLELLVLVPAGEEVAVALCAQATPEAASNSAIRIVINRIELPAANAATRPDRKSEEQQARSQQLKRGLRQKVRCKIGAR